MDERKRNILMNYIAGRYGSPSAAKTFWLAHNWY